MAVFLYGALQRRALLESALGRMPELRPGWLADAASGPASADARESAGMTGGLAEGLAPEEAARLDFVLRGLGLEARETEVETESGPVGATAYVVATGDRTVLNQLEGELACPLVDEVAAEHGRRRPEAVAARLTSIAAKAQARILARDAAPTTLRRRAEVGDIAVAETRKPYARFFEVSEYTVSWRRFDGTMGPAIERAAFVSADSAVLLPYDARRDRVLLLEQFRAGPLARGDPQPWHLEPVAGRVDPGETPEGAARREAREEAGLAVGALEPITRGYPSPGAKSEFLHIFLGHAELPDGAAGIGGLEAEGEDIRGHVVAFDRLMALVESGEAGTLPLILAAHWLARRRSWLRGRA